MCAAPDGHLLLAWGGGEAGWGLLRTDLNGRRQWGIRQGGDNVACDWQHIYMSDGDEVRVYDMKDGRPLNYGSGSSTLETFAHPPGAIRGLSYGNGTLYVSYGKASDAAALIDAGTGKLNDKTFDAVALFDAATGKLKGRAWHAATPGRLALTPNGALLAISGESVHKINAAADVPLIVDHLDHPQGLAVDAAGHIYVSNSGKLQNVSVFSPAGSSSPVSEKPAGGRASAAMMRTACSSRGASR